MTKATSHTTTALKELNKAINNLTLNSRRCTRAEREKVIDVLGKSSHNPDVIKILLDALRRFGQNFTDEEKIRIAEIIRRQEKIPPLTAKTLRDSLEKIIVQERSPRVGAAFMAAFEKVTE